MSLWEHARVQAERAPVVARMIDLLAAPSAFSRTSLDPGHFTASAIVVCPENQRVLLIHHVKLGRWLQPGGHIEPTDTSLLAAAEREAIEETGALGLEPLYAGVFDVDVHLIPASSKEGAHAHFDVRYAFRAQTDRLAASAEVRAARWLEFGRVAELNREESLIRCVDRLRAR
jgi:8-oxo-dGTP pyrophosphatase MutT (NUDIX family)